jgi:GAF domain-containing protein
VSDDAAPTPGDPAAAVTRLAAANRLRERLRDLAGLVPVADAAAEFFYEFFDADASAITLMRGGWFRTLVTVGEAIPGQIRHPDGQTYPVDTYPTVARRLEGGSGYVSSLGNDGGIPESRVFLVDYKKATCLGAPISYAGETVGEVFVSRASGRPHYTGHELALALDLARQLGLRIGPGIKAQDQVNAGWWPSAVPPSEAG